MIRAFALCLALAPLPALGAEKIVAGLSANRVSITANFDGSEILIYGAVKRETPSPKDSRLEVIVTVEGPSTPLVIRRKDHRAGIWLNNASVTIDSAPSFYTVATTGPIKRILSETEDLRHKITIARAIRAIGSTSESETPEQFIDALQRIRRSEARYRLAESSVALIDETLFRTDVVLPSNLIEGDYRVRIFITRDGAVIDHLERKIGVRKAGLERDLYLLATQRPLLYGFLSLAMAIFAGWAASAGFRLMRR